MAEYWGFDQVDIDGLIFTSYNSLDWRRVAPIALELRKMGVPIWYDYGLEAGTQGWRTQISIHIGKASAMVLFVTKGIFEREESYVIIEYSESKRLGIPVIPVFLDDVGETAFFRAMDAQYRSYVMEWEGKEGVAYSSAATTESLARAIKHRLDNSTQVTYKSVPWVDNAAEREAKAEAVRAAARQEAAAERKRAAEDEEQEVYIPIVITEGTYTLANTPISSELLAGSRVTLGRYPQSSNTPEPIMWRVLDIIDGNALMISESLLDCKKYHEQDEDVIWETCTLRKWLNTDFMSTAFSAEDRKKLCRARIWNSDNSRYATKGGNATEDYVYCLSIDEAKKYISDDDVGMAKPTAYARKNGCYVDSNDGTGWWWLRSPGGSGNFASIIYPNGSIYRLGYQVTSDNYCVRPVILVRL